MAEKIPIVVGQTRRYDIDLDPDSEICSTIGSAETIFNLPEAFIDPGDYVLVLDPVYELVAWFSWRNGGDVRRIPIEVVAAEGLPAAAREGLDAQRAGAGEEVEDG